MSSRVLLLAEYKKHLALRPLMLHHDVQDREAEQD
jgi:hypothetical protein